MVQVHRRCGPIGPLRESRRFGQARRRPGQAAAVARALVAAGPGGTGRGPLASCCSGARYGVARRPRRPAQATEGRLGAGSRRPARARCRRERYRRPASSDRRRRRRPPCSGAPWTGWPSGRLEARPAATPPTAAGAGPAAGRTSCRQWPSCSRRRAPDGGVPDVVPGTSKCWSSAQTGRKIWNGVVRTTWRYRAPRQLRREEPHEVARVRPVPEHRDRPDVHGHVLVLGVEEPGVQRAHPLQRL